MGKKSGSHGSGARIGRKEYEAELARLQGELVAMQEWIKATGARICLVFEGRDTAGKGGTIKRIVERVSPRVFRVVALAAPTERERSQMYVQRYLSHFPAAGEVVIFDRSWYNRAGVERVMGFCEPEQTERFLVRDPAAEAASRSTSVTDRWARARARRRRCRSRWRLAATWDPRLARTHGREIADEAKKKGNDVVFAPTVNIMRTPQGGRTYEAYGEDTFLTGRTPGGYRDAQSTGVIADVKHYLANNQEGQDGVPPSPRRTADASRGRQRLRARPCARCTCRSSRRP